MANLALVIPALLCAIQSLRSKRLILSAIWLAGVIVLLAIFFFQMGAHQVAVIKLSVGAGLVTVLLIFAMGVIGEESITAISPCCRNCRETRTPPHANKYGTYQAIQQTGFQSGAEKILRFLTIPKSSMPNWIDLIRNEYMLIGPKRRKRDVTFDKIQSTTELEFDYPTTVLPPKKNLLPTKEDLIHFNFEDTQRNIKPIFENPKVVIFGVHTCDLHAIVLLDHILNQEYPDQHYLARRKATTIVSIECLRPCSEHAFCKSMGTLSVHETFDLHLTDLGDRYVLDIGSDKGAELIKSLASVQEGTEEDYLELRKTMSEKWSSFQYRLDFDISELPSLLSLSYNSPLWDQLEERCLACGLCTLVCPTCYCFNIIDEIDLNLRSGSRMRVWDSCQLDRFATVAGGHNFRESRAARIRHRFLHKGKYQTESSGLAGCVGCGRCTQTCLAHISTIEILNELAKQQTPEIFPELEVAS